MRGLLRLTWIPVIVGALSVFLGGNNPLAESLGGRFFLDPQAGVLLWGAGVAIQIVIGGILAFRRRT